ncbi:hypothetical protein XU18_3615 [Perkinsela sp. CCAP 1560/4]|nr:hypothetical protein XU18_3615 [Perkinsela sp. CCAP 1560/4]|eukprot:KNH05349.1 hypothetical protein XU18_3615 [Perkinsela sp. CCAP 1560/4]
MRFELVFLDAVDPSLGRVDLESLPQQALMEMVIEGITNKEKICGDADEPKDIKEWKGVTIEDGQVVEIAWHLFWLEGSVHFEWLPSSVREVMVTENYLTDTLDLESLPTAMENLFLGFNASTGSIDLGSCRKEANPLPLPHLGRSRKDIPQNTPHTTGKNNQLNHGQLC